MSDSAPVAIGAKNAIAAIATHRTALPFIPLPS